MKRLLILIRHALAHFRVYRLTIQLSDTINASDACRNDDERINNSLARRTLGRELVHARMRLMEFAPPGERQTWEIA